MKRTLMLTAISGHLFAGLAIAQEDTRRIEAPVIVTAPGPDRSSDELIGNATALDRGDILARLSGTLGDTLSSEPGVSSTYFGQGASRPVLRGLGSERVQVLTNGIGVIDVSAASPDHQVTADGIDAEKIEILRGPAALAYGGQAIGGVVNVIDGLIVDTLPERIVSGEAFGAWNSVNDGSELGGRVAFVNGPLVFSLSASQRDFGDYDIPGLAESRQLRHRESLEHDHDDDDDDDHDHDHDDDEIRGTLPNSFLKTETFGGGVSWVGERAFAGVAIRRQTSTYGLPGAHAHHHDDHDDDDDDDDDDDHDHDHDDENPFIDLKQTRYDFRGGVNLDGDILKAITATLSYSDYKHTEFEEPGDAASIFETKGWEGRVELDHAIAGFEGAAGIQFLDKSLDASGAEAFLTPTDTRSLAVFLYETRDWDNGFGIEGGARIERLEHKNVDAGKVRFDLFSASAGAHQHFGDGWFAGAQFAYTERGPNESELFAFGPHLATQQFEVGDTGLSKEKGFNLEGTLRWRGNNASFGVNLFHTRFDNFIYLVPGAIEEDGELVTEEDGLPVYLFTQEDAKLHGGEIYGEYYLDAGPLGADWKFRGSLDHVRASLDSGGSLPYIPPLTVNAAAEANWGLFEAGINAQWADNQKRVGAGQLGTSDYTIVNLRAALNLSEMGFGRDGTQLFIEARNVTDEEARLATSVLRDTVPLPGRNYRTGLRVTF